MIYIPVDVRAPIKVKKNITVQSGITNNFPEIVFELHDGCKYFDLGDNYVVTAAVTNTDKETVSFSGTLSVMNPHRGQILCQPVYQDFTMTGLNTLTVKCVSDENVISFQTTIYVQSISPEIISHL